MKKIGILTLVAAVLVLGLLGATVARSGSEDWRSWQARYLEQWKAKGGTGAAAPIEVKQVAPGKAEAVRKQVLTAQRSSSEDADPAAAAIERLLPTLPRHEIIRAAVWISMVCLLMDNT